MLVDGAIVVVEYADRLIAEGRIQVNGQIAQIGDFADQDIDLILADGKRISIQQKRYIRR